MTTRNGTETTLTPGADATGLADAGSLSGAVVGVVVVTFVVEFLRTLEHGISVGTTTFALPSGSQEIGLGVVMALILILRPSGLTGGREFGTETPLPRNWHSPTAPFERSKSPG